MRTRACTTLLMNSLHTIISLYAQGGELLGVRKIGEKYRCNVCGNEVTVTKVGGGTLVCCGQDMELIT